MLSLGELYTIRILYIVVPLGSDDEVCLMFKPSRLVSSYFIFIFATALLKRALLFGIFAPKDRLLIVSLTFFLYHVASFSVPIPALAFSFFIEKV
jgi:hypothetical protein